ncbi:hypothetical protein CsSME_00010605 [Camellia sinensis var. sinensis]
MELVCYYLFPILQRRILCSMIIAASRSILVRRVGSFMGLHQGFWVISLVLEAIDQASLEDVALINGPITLDLVTRRTIGSGRAENGLYFWDQPTKLAYHSIQFPTTNEDLWLWHWLLEHPFFHLLRRLFLSLLLHHLLLGL